MRWTKVLVCLVLSILCSSLSQAQEKSDVGLPDENEDTVTTAAPDKGSESTVTAGAGVGAAADEVQIPFPIVLPPANRTADIDYDIVAIHPCLLYLEGINIFVWKEQDTPLFRHAVIGNAGFDSSNMTEKYKWSNSQFKNYVDCTGLSNFTIGEATFAIEMDLAADIGNSQDEEKADLFSIGSGPFGLVLHFIGDSNAYWNLSTITTTHDINIKTLKGGSSQIPDLTLKAGSVFNGTANMGNMGISSWNQYGYACSQTGAAFHVARSDPSPKWYIGIGFINIQVDLKAYYHKDDKNQHLLAFNRDVSDCVGTFSVGSWMGIFCSLVMASILMFGYLMLQSVQTMDRFDDPKQKQIVINFKE